jgi:hypothetical protein
MMSKLRTVLITASIAFPIGLIASPMKGHPNLLAARSDVDKAWDKITAAQNANEFDLSGHAAKAKDAIKLAVDELKLAAEQSNENHGR